ncbi:MAG: DUF3445 domain-containing protein [Pseudomonadota bacterium]
MTSPWVMGHALDTPFMQTRTAHPPGITPLDPAEWIRVDPDFAAQMAYRSRLLADVPEVVLEAQDGAGPLIREFYHAMIAHLAGRSDYMIEGDEIIRPDGVQIPCDPARPLETICNLIADDICLLLPDAEAGEYILVAGLLCFPSRWLLSEKMGRPLTVIHEPVPEYDADLARRVNRLFEAIRPGRPMVRVNWLIHASAELHLPLGLSDKLVAEADPECGLYLRTERQTLVRLPETGGVVFGIKTSICPLDRLTPDQSAALMRELEVKHRHPALAEEDDPVLEVARDRLSAQAMR